MKRGILTSFGFALPLSVAGLVAVLLLFSPVGSAAQSQGWPQQYGGVMLQGFDSDSYDDTQWALLERQADDLSS